MRLHMYFHGHVRSWDMMHPEVSVVLKDIENIMLLIRQMQITEITAESS